MKRCMLLLLGFFIGSTGLLIIGATPLFAFPGRAAIAQGRGNDQGEDHGRGRGRGHDKKEDHGRHGPPRFNDRDRHEASRYFKDHRREFREDRRWNDEYESRLRDGYVLDRDMIRFVRPCPPGLVREFPPSPRGYRYVILGDHVVLVDSGYRVADVIHLEFNLGL